VVSNFNIFAPFNMVKLGEHAMCSSLTAAVTGKILICCAQL